MTYQFLHIRAPSCDLSLGFRSEQLKKPLSGFGYLIPSKEKEDYLGVLFTSYIFKNRAQKITPITDLEVLEIRNGKS